MVRSRGEGTSPFSSEMLPSFAEATANPGGGGGGSDGDGMGLGAQRRGHPRSDAS